MQLFKKIYIKSSITLKRFGILSKKIHVFVDARYEDFRSWLWTKLCESMQIYVKWFKKKSCIKKTLLFTDASWFRVSMNLLKIELYKRCASFNTCSQSKLYIGLLKLLTHFHKRIVYKSFESNTMC